MPLKIKDFSRKTEALKLDGGGEIRTLVLSEHPTHDYMLIVSEIQMIMLEDAPQLITRPSKISAISTQRRDGGPHQEK